MEMKTAKTIKKLLKLFAIIIFMLLVQPPNLFAGFIDHFSQTDDIGRYKVPHFGHSRILVIPVNLDTNKRKSLNIKKIRQFFDAKHRGLNFPRYFEQNSLGRFTLEADVIDPINFKTCPIPKTGADCTPKRGNILALGYGIPLVREIIRRAKKEHKLDFSRYDINGKDQKPDGFCDGIIIILNGSWFGIALPFGIVNKNFELEFDNVKINMVAMSSGFRALTMAIHEFGHLLGFADLYDEYRHSYGLQNSLMGSWKYDSKSLPLLDAFSRMKIGWANVEQISGEVDLLIPPVLDSGKVYKLGTGTEYFLLENRSANGIYDNHLKKAGLAVYHVNLRNKPGSQHYDFIKTVINCPNCKRWRPFIMNVQADGRYDMQYRLSNFANDDLFQTGDAFLSSPKQLALSDSNVWFYSNYYSGRDSQIEITNIDSMSFLPFIKATLKAPIIKNTRAESKPNMSNTKKEIGSLQNFAAFAAIESSNTGCMSIDDLYLRILPVLLLVLWLIIRPIIKRKYENRLRKSGQLKEDQDLKNRF